MDVAQRPTWWHVLQGSRREALLAVDLDNRAASERSFEGFVAHMHMAWLYLALRLACGAMASTIGTANPTDTSYVWTERSRRGT